MNIIIHTLAETKIDGLSLNLDNIEFIKNVVLEKAHENNVPVSDLKKGVTVEIYFSNEPEFQDVNL